ncbi:carboxylate--amine ligase [Litorihabitans aurantiacus]|uniref:Carboxylate--amine ligase n=1 Tax=Litorihabitans aurantiacus TaxID=1930061 RepID=A0AA37XE42_9MICO|nr:carboxylate--amine ligase [Litorihabitans aurantiacus]GMA31415.1 carboxylate--amine ligase [Litorihabitans aurantiacus]
MRPIVLGGDIGAYATARAFHEAFGVRTVVVAGAATWPVRDSRIVDLRVHGGDGAMTAASLAPVLRAIVAEAPGHRHLLLASADWLVGEAVALRAELPDVVVPYPDTAVVERVGDKGAVAAACERLGIPHPRTHVAHLRGRGQAPVVADPPLPAVVKFASTAQAHDVEYAGRAKVHRVSTLQELDDLLARIAATPFEGDVLVQEELPGGDTSMAAVNVMVDPDGAVTFAQLGRVLLEEHTPSALGNSVAQITADASRDAVAREAIDGVLRLLTDLEWRGFANVDLMRGADGTYRVLEVNPRVGRSGYAPTASGYNVARMYVDSWVERLAAPADPVLATREHLFVLVPLAIVRRYAPAARARIRELRRRGAVTNPLLYRAERHPRRWLFIAVAMVNQVRKFRRYHPGA